LHDADEPTPSQQLLENPESTEREDSGLPWRRRRLAGVAKQDLHWPRHERIGRRRGEDRDAYLCSGSQRAMHCRKCPRRVDEEHEAKPTDGCIEALNGQVQILGGANQSRDIGKASGTGVLPYVVQHRVGDVARHDMPLCSDPTGSIQRLAPCAAGQVEHPRTRVDASHVQH
jgi:hypothetical protein